MIKISICFENVEKFGVNKFSSEIGFKVEIRLPGQDLFCKKNKNKNQKFIAKWKLDLIAKSCHLGWNFGQKTLIFFIRSW